MAKAPSNSEQIRTPSSLFQPKPLSIEQRNAIDLLKIGKSDGEVAEALGLQRTTVWGWRTRHLVFQSELEQARGDLWRHTAERLRGLMSKALDNIATAIDGGNLKASFELLRAVGIYGDPNINHIRDWRLESLIRQEAERRVKAEGIPEDATERMLINMSQNPAYLRRLEEITSELMREFGEEPHE